MTRARDIANQGAGTYGSITADDLTVDTNTLYVDSATNQVGIGTTSPQDAFHINSSTADIRLTDSDNGNYSRIVGSSYDLYLNADAGNTGNGSLICTVGGGTERMRITDEGEVIVGDTTTANSKLFVGGGGTTGDNGLAVADSSEGSGYKMLSFVPISIPAGGSISLVFAGFNGDAPYAVKFRYGGFSGAVTQPSAHCGFSVEYMFNGTGNMSNVIETFEYGDQFNSGDVSISGAGGGLLTLTIQHHGAHASSVGFRCWLIAEVYGFAAHKVYLQSQS